MAQHQKWSFTDRLAVRIADFAIKRPWTTIVAAVSLIAMSAAGLGGLSLATNYRAFFSPKNPELVAFEDFQATYTKNDNILFFVKPKTADVFSNDITAAIEDLTERAWQIPYAIRVDSISNFQHSWADGDDLTVEDLIIDGESLTATELAAKHQITRDEPLLFRNLLAADSSATSVNVVLQYPEQSEAEVPTAVAVAREIEQEIEAAYDVDVALTGVSMLNNAFAEAGIKDATTLVPAMYLVLLLATALVLRSFVGTIATLLVIMASTLTAMGITGHYGLALTPISLTAPTVIMTLAIADSIHILVSLLSLMREGKSKTTALREALRINFLAVSVTSLTTIIGFAALNFSDSPPFVHLGNITAIGIAAAWFFSITLLPAAVRLLPLKVTVRENGTRSTAALDRLAQFVTSKFRPIMVVGLLVSGGLIAALPNLELNDQWVEYFDERVTFRTDTDFALASMPGIYPMEFSVTADGAEGISDPEYLQNLEKFTEWLRVQPDVEHVYSYTDIIKRLNKNMHGDDESFYRIPNDRRLAAQYLFLYEISLPFGLDLNDRVNIDKSATRVTATLRQVTTDKSRAFITRSEQWLRDNTPEYMHTRPTSANVMFAFISQRNIEGMLTGNGVAVVLIALVLMLALRNARLGLLSILPNVLPILMTYGLWTVLVGRLGMAAATVSATSLGIIVDDTVHFLSKYIRARRENGYNQPEAISYAFRTVGLAIVSNSIILAAGFTFLAASTFKVNYEMGLLTALAIVVALAFDFFLLPALLMLGYRKDTDSEETLLIGHGSTNYENAEPVQQSA